MQRNDPSDAIATESATFIPFDTRLYVEATSIKVEKLPDGARMFLKTSTLDVSLAALQVTSADRSIPDEFRATSCLSLVPSVVLKEVRKLQTGYTGEIVTVAVADDTIGFDVLVNSRTTPVVINPIPKRNVNIKLILRTKTTGFILFLEKKKHRVSKNPNVTNLVKK
jgi:hypothetical protein